MFRRILVPIDGSPTSNRGLEEAIGLARDQKANLCLLHVIDGMVVMAGTDGMMGAPPSYVEDFMRALRATGKKLLARAEARVRKRRVRVETVLLETVGRRGFARVLMGSDAELVVREIPVPVLLVRSPSRKRR